MADNSSTEEAAPNGPVYEVWTVATANLWGAWDTEDEAIAALRIAGETHGGEYLGGLVLCIEEDGQTRMLADGQQIRAAVSHP